MYVSKVTHEQTVTVPTGGFSNVKPGYTVEIVLEKGDSAAEAAAKAEKLVEDLLEAKIKGIMDDLGDPDRATARGK